jgi:hypothetical protein
VSDLDPSSDSDDQWASELEEKPSGKPFIGNNLDADSDSDSDSDVGDTPFNTFQRSFIFPDPNSSTGSFSSGNTEATPIASLVDITANDLKSSLSLYQATNDGRPTERITTNRSKSTPTAGPSWEGHKPFPAASPPPKRRQL